VAETFSEPEPNVIESSSGFSVRVLGRTGLRYTERGRSVWIDSEVLATPEPPTIAMYKPSMKVWEDPANPEPVTDDERDRIASNIKRAFESCGYGLVVIGPFDWSSVALRPPGERPRPLRLLQASQAGTRR
jgi:hypothetical protein